MAYTASMKHFLNFLILTAAVSSGSCGDDDGDRRYRSGLDDDDATVASLDENDREQICRTLDAHLEVTIQFDEIARLACLPGAILLGGSREGCEARLNDCVKNAPPPVRVRADATDERACFDSLADCNASVAALESCVNVSIDAALDFLERVSCTRYDDPTTQEMARAMETARGCAELSASCDDFGPLL